ncbi:MAG: YkgJ family cysteine cluster protein [Deferribacteraceae bacterium]|jgi:Fe-S-cluster containining protein|nr:YkgJ family cysteine cluster protein [Deferribacteraceae bacterium]
MNGIKCFVCGACCIAYSISAFNKPAGVKCIHLRDDGLCGDYAERPDVCRAFKPDELCVLISTISLAEKVEVISKVYGDA